MRFLGGGLVPCQVGPQLGRGGVPKWQPKRYEPEPDLGEGLRERGHGFGGVRKPEPMRFDGIGVGPPGYEVIKSTHRTITGKAYDWAKPSFNRRSSRLFGDYFSGYLKTYSEAPDKNDIADNNKGHCYNAHEEAAGRDPGDALKRIEACARALQLAMKGQRFVPLAIKRLKRGQLANFAEEIEQEVYWEPFLPKMPEKLTPIGKGAFVIYWLGELLDDARLFFFRKPKWKPEEAHAIAVSMMAGQMLHYIQDLMSIWHTVARKGADGRWVVERALEHFSFELEVARRDAAGELKVSAPPLGPVSLFGRGRLERRIGFRDWVEALLFEVKEEAKRARGRADGLISARERGEDIVTGELIDETVSRAAAFCADVLLTVANSVGGRGERQA